MKKLICLGVLITVLTACTDRTEFGDCIGLFDDRNPTLQYKLSIWNAILAATFVSTVVVPVVWGANQAMCPVGRKP